MSAPSPLEALAHALRSAIDECRAHNEDYHHRTPDEMFEEWERVLRAAATAPAARPSPSKSQK